MNEKSKKADTFILVYAFITLVIHIVLILKSPQRQPNQAYIYDEAIPAIINFIAATYIMARLMQQMFPNYFLAHVRAEWGAHLWRTELKANINDCLGRLNDLQGAAKDLNMPREVSEARVILKTMRDRIWYLKFVDLFPKAFRDGHSDMNLGVEIADLQNTFTALRRTLETMEHDLAHLGGDPGLVQIPSPLLFSHIAGEASNQRKFGRIQRYKQELESKTMVLRGFTEL